MINKKINIGLWIGVSLFIWGINWAIGSEDELRKSTYVCQRTEIQPVIDGKLNDSVWQTAFKSAIFVDIEDTAYKTVRCLPERYFQMVWDSQYLYIAGTINTKQIWATHRTRDAIIYQDPDFEIFIDPDADGKNYIELEINANNCVWDLFLTAPYGTPSQTVLHDWNIPGLKHAVAINGTLNQSADVDTAWTVELAIPWESITGHHHLPRRGEPPRPGSSMKMNFSCVDWYVKPDSSHQSTYRKMTNANGKVLPEMNHVWAPTGKINIHMPEKWGEVRFSDRLAGTWESFVQQTNDFSIYVWAHGNDHPDSPILWKQRFNDYKAAGINGIIVDGGVESVAKIASYAAEFNLCCIAWIWSLNQPENAEALTHPDWYSVNRNGVSCFENGKRPYVDYYQFLCPNHPDVRKHLEKTVTQYAQIPHLDAIQMDYIRMVDVILPKGLWKNYNLVMDREMAEFDFCYCLRCLSKFELLYKRKVNSDPSTDEQWREFRLKSVAEAANTMAETARRFDRMPCGAAVFPTPKIAAGMVRQDWRLFNLDFALPMDYHSFYLEKISWIGTVTREANEQVHHRFPLFPGIHLPDISGEKLGEILTDIHKNGAAGAAFFSHDTLKTEHLRALRNWKDKN